MQVIVRHSQGGTSNRGTGQHDAVAACRREEIPTPLAAAVFFAGAMVEALGIALIAEYGWMLLGSLIAVVGFTLGTFANRRWPSSGQPGWPSMVGDRLGALSRRNH
jgi:hypothetical protein